MIERGAVRGVRYRTEDGTHEVRARLAVGTDGRFSLLRRLAGLEADATRARMREGLGPGNMPARYHTR